MIMKATKTLVRLNTLSPRMRIFHNQKMTLSTPTEMWCHLI